MIRWRTSACAVILGLLPAIQAGTEPEDELKSAIVLNFIRYAEWPRLAAGAPLIVGVVGRPSLEQALQRTLEGKSVSDHPVRVIEIKGPPDGVVCQAIYIASDKDAEIKQELQQPYAAHALTIGETKNFLDLGGSVNLLLIDGHMSFEVSLEALTRSGVNISSRLLRFGQIRGRGKGGAS